MLNHPESQRPGKQSIFTLLGNKKRAESQRKSFETVFANILHRKDNEFCTLESPYLNQQIEDLRPSFDDPCISSLSTPISRVPLAQERKKYITLKQKIEAAMLESSKKEFSSLKELFAEKQTILTSFLNDFTGQIERQCKQKGDILKYIWNTMLNLIESISENVSINMRSRQKNELENNLRSHVEYQGLLERYHKKQIMLNEKSRAERVTINSLVYELRFKRKEVNKLYRNQKLLVNKLNEYKSDNLNLQSSYIDLMCSLRDMPPEKVVMLMKAREEINKSRQVKFKITSSRKNAKNEIKAQLSNDKIQDLQNLYEEIKEIANSDVGSPQLISTLIEASIENFGIKNDDIGISEQKVVPVPHKVPKIHAETQTNEYEVRDKTKINHSTQFGYIERLTTQLINHRDTQTYCQYPKKKLLINVATEVIPLEMNRQAVKKFTVVRACQESFLFQVSEAAIVTRQASLMQKRHKKHSSDTNFSINSRKTMMKSFGMHELADYIEEKDDLVSSSDDSLLQAPKKGADPKNKRSTKLKKASGRMMNPFPKERISLPASNSLIKISSNMANLDSDQTVKKSNFIPSPSTYEDLTTTNTEKPSQKKLSQAKQQRKSQESVKKKPSITSPKFTKSREDVPRNNFLQKNNYFNIEIDAVKQQEINNMFSNNDYAQMDLSDEEMKNYFELSSAERERENIERLRVPDANLLTQGSQKDDRSSVNLRKSSTLSAARSAVAKRQSQTVKYEDENELLLNLCRLNRNKSHKKFKEKISIFKYHDEFTCVRDKIEFVARDVKNLLAHKQAMLKKTMNSKNIKNTYKVLMMTFSKAYDAYNKGILKGNLIYPLFQSFALIYGNINNNEIYKKMINFIASLAVCRENAILRFFLFFLGLDTMSPYSQKVTISEVYLCLKLLEKISVDGKVTLNIEAIYTDTAKIKEQLMDILKEEKIPQALSRAIETRVQKQLQSSCLYKNSTTQNSHLKLNIYNIILLIIQEVIKCKNSLKETFIPILNQYQQYQTSKKLPVYIIEVILSDWKSSNFSLEKLRSLVEMITKNGKRETVTIQQFCSILFEYNLVSIDQIYQKSEFVYRKNWRIPPLFIQQLQQKTKENRFASELQKRQAEMFFKISSHSCPQLQENPTIERMRRIIFEKHYQRSVTRVTQEILGPLVFL